MYSREESKKIREEFWISFGKQFPRKWLLYNTKMKDLSLKFHFDQKSAQVSLDIESSDEVRKAYYFEKLQSLQNILKEEYLKNAIFEEYCKLENGKTISRVFVRKEGVNIHKKEDWTKVQAWLYEKMNALEHFFMEYRDFIEI